VPTDADGRYFARTTVPKDYSDHDHDPIGELFRAMGRHNRRAAHIHIKVWRGEDCLLTTQIFIPGNPYLDSDYVEGAVSPDLTIDMQPAASGEANAYQAVFDIAVGPPKRR
jgi:protocatechuate 3,4-dioxygenase beta subunit